ncbi:MobF family relaxase [Ilumatobacter sp.]|uniref:MobF family relaxase n=1 Tax=Ilumatobacter sp. TaxID=1967498 RepID=UPI003B515BAA
MLSLWKLRVGAEDYYLDQVAKGLDDYYSGAGETCGRWIGRASSALGLDAAVDADGLRAVLAGLAPGTGLTPNDEQVRTFKNRVPGFDLTFSAPKSVSILYALGDPLVRSEVVAATDTAVTEALAWLEREACFVRRGSNYRSTKTPAFEKWGTRRLPGRGFIAAQFRHRTSRLGDPQLHSHVLVANLTQGPDGRWTALDGQALYRSKMAAGSVYRSVLRHELSKRLGVEWGPVHKGLSEIAGIPSRVRKLFSKRRSEIETELARTGRTGPAAADEASLDTRPTKTEADPEMLDERWLAEAATVDYGPGDIDQLLAHGRGRQAAEIGERPLTADTRIAVRSVDRHTGEVHEEHLSIADIASRIGRELPRTDAVTSRFDVQNAVADLLTSAGSVRLLERLTDAVLAHSELVPMPTNGETTAGWEETWTTRTLADAEAELVEMFTADPGTPVAAIDPDVVERVHAQMAAAGRSLGADQVDTVRRLATQGLGVEAVVGKAGTGKTYTMNAVRHVFAAAGFEVIGACPTARAARELSDGAGIESFTIDKLLAHGTIGRRHVLIVDEAAMVATLKLHELVGRARRAGAKVIVVGDHHQLPEIEAGGSFKRLLDTVGDHRCELTINRRQRHEWEHAALDHLRNGDITTFWKTYLDHDRVVLDEHHSDVQQAAIADWFNAYRHGSNAHMLAGTNAEVDVLNDTARDTAIAAGLITGPTITIDHNPFQVGDRVVLTKNAGSQLDLDTSRPARVDNGMIATITHIDHTARRIDIELVNGRSLRLDTAYLDAGHVAYGYATTFHKAQGLTCDDVFVVGPAGMYRESGYVALSRARNEAHLYATTKDAATIGERGHSTGIPLPSEHAGDPEADMVGTLGLSKANQFATADHPDLTRIADLAHTRTIGQLTDRLAHINRTCAQLRRDGHTDPTRAVERLDRAIRHRSLMHEGGRVNALDRDNIGVVDHLLDHCGAAHVRFTTSDGARTYSKVIEWHDLRPIDEPDPAPLTDTATRYLTELDEVLTGELYEWERALGIHGISTGERRLVEAAIEHRRRQQVHALRATPPEWLRWWVGDRPDDPIGAAVYDEHLADLAAYRDTHHISDHVAGYGPRPDHPDLVDEWKRLVDAALETRTWLAIHQPDLEPEHVDPIALDDARARIDELDALFATAPPDVQQLIDDITHDPELDPNERQTQLADATRRQQARADWILEHWPHVIEHLELTAISEPAGLLDHWPIRLPAPVQHLHDQLVQLAVDDPEPRTLHDLDQARYEASPGAQAAAHRAELDTNHRHIDELRTDAANDPAGIEIARQNIDRLRERNRDLRRLIDHNEMLQTFIDWGDSPSPELDAAIARRTRHLAHTAITTHAPWVARLTEQAHDADLTITADKLIHLVQDVAAYRERAAITGRDPLGDRPAWDHPLAATHDDFAERLQLDPPAIDLTMC